VARPIVVARHWNPYLCTVVLRESEHSYPIYHLKITRIGEGEVKDWCLEAEYEASPQVRPCYVPLWLMPTVLQELWMVQGKGSKATVPLGTFGQSLRDSVDHESLQSCVGIQVSAGWLGAYNIRDIGVVMRPRDYYSKPIQKHDLSRRADIHDHGGGIEDQEHFTGALAAICLKLSAGRCRVGCENPVQVQRKRWLQGHCVR